MPEPEKKQAWELQLPQCPMCRQPLDYVRGTSFIELADGFQEKEYQLFSCICGYDCAFQVV